MVLKNKVALITGGASGIGKRIAIEFVKKGADVAIADLNKEGLLQLSKEMEDYGKKIIYEALDISDEEKVKGFVKKITKELTTIHILVNNASYIKTEYINKFELSEWDKVFNVCLKGSFICCKSVVEEMMKNQYGKIINIASVGGERGFSRACAYGSAKAGLIGLTKTLAVELARYKINVNAILPCPTDTEHLRSAMSTEEIEKRINRIPMGRLGNPIDMAKAAIFLASDESEFITGHSLCVDGGFMIAGIS